MSQIDATLSERGTRYGAFTGHAEITQGIKDVMFSTDNWASLADDQKEALEMVAHKIGRILNGDPNYIDSWHDIIGYTRLVEQRLEEEQSERQAKPLNPEKAAGEQPCAVCGEVHDGAVHSDLLKRMQAAGMQIIFVDEETGLL